MISICVLCGSDSDHTAMLNGVNGFTCIPCLGEAFVAVARAYPKPAYADEATTVLDANQRCLICANPIVRSSLVAYRGPYRFCGDCLKAAFETCFDTGPGRLRIVSF